MDLIFDPLFCLLHVLSMHYAHSFSLVFLHLPLEAKRHYNKDIFNFKFQFELLGNRNFRVMK